MNAVENQQVVELLAKLATQQDQDLCVLHAL